MDDSGDSRNITVEQIEQIVKERLSRPIANAKQVEFVRRMLNTSADLDFRSHDIHSFKNYLKTTLQPKIEQEMRRVSNMAILVLEIGSWKRTTEYKGHLVAKFFFHTRRMMWEIFENHMKNKIEIQWDDIKEMKVDLATYAEFGMLQIKLSSSKTPLFYQEIDPKPRKHIQNIITTDFTGGEALRSRVHTLWFLKSDFDKHYERLQHYEPEFAKLIKSALPNPQRPCFYPCPRNSGLNVSFGCILNMSQTVNQQSNFQDRLGSVHVEQGEAWKGALVPTGGLIDVMQESAAHTASKEILLREIQLIVPPLFQETRPRPERHGQALTHRFFSYFANINNAGNNTTADFNRSELQNYPSYQHHQARDEQNHEIQTTSNQKFDTVERATPPSVPNHYAATDNNGPREASNTMLLVHQHTGNSADATTKPETIQGNQNMRKP